MPQILLLYVTIILLAYKSVASYAEPNATNMYNGMPLNMSGIPCTIAGEGFPAGCNPNRITPCGTHSGYPVILSNSNTACSTNPGTFHRGDVYIVQFTGKKSQTCNEILMHVGECWGKNPINGGDFGCNGRCGQGCGSNICSNWAEDCLKHDACSWYFGSKGQIFDDDCGEEFLQAIDDWMVPCIFGDHACELYYPSQSSSCCSSAFPDDGMCGL